MDIISQLQEQTNKIAAITFNTFGTLQRDSPAVKLSPDYPEPPANLTEDATNFAEQPKLMSEALVQAAKQVWHVVLPITELFHNLCQMINVVSCYLWGPEWIVLVLLWTMLLSSKI